MTKTILLLLSIVLGTGCDGVPDTKLPGTYIAKLGESRQEIVILSDGRYTNTFYEFDKLLWRETDRWNIEIVSNQRGMSFKQFRWGLPGYLYGQGYWFVIPKKSYFEGPKLCYDLDLVRCFEREQKH
jgi:hypothetical protein